MKRQVSIPVPAHYDDVFETSWKRMAGEEPGWLLDQRQLAFDRFRQVGFPTRYIEAWKYTDVSDLAKVDFRRAAPYPLEPAAIAALPLVHRDELTFVFVDGYYNPELSTARLPTGVSVGPLLQAAGTDAVRDVLSRTNLQVEGPFTCLNRALWCDGISIDVADHCVLEPRIHAVFVHSGAQDDALICPRLVTRIGQCAQVSLAITHASLDRGRALNNAVVDVDVGNAATVDLYHTQFLSARSYHVCTTRISQQRDSHVRSLDFAMGSAIARHDLSVSMAGTGCTAAIDGVMVARRRQLLDAHTAIEHRQPHCTSRQLYKGLLDDRATTVFNGLVRVHPGACGTDGEQMNRNLLMSTKAKANSKPELEIANDDVRCTHGATVGQISEQEMFYLESRGIAPETARDMLARGFVEEVLYRIDDGRRRADLHGLLDRYFETRADGSA